MITLEELREKEAVLAQMAREEGIAGINHRTEIISGKVREAEAGILGESEPSTNNDLGRVPVGSRFNI